MLWLALCVVITAIGAFAIVVLLNRLRFEGRVAREVQEMWLASTTPAAIDRHSFEKLPRPVGGYLSKALGQHRAAFRTVRLRHGGTFRPKLDGSWFPIQGEQYFSTDPPGFIWHGRIRIAPGIWIDARDKCVNAVGNMFVSAESPNARLEE